MTYSQKRAAKIRDIKDRFFGRKHCIECGIGWEESGKHLILHHLIPEDKVSSQFWLWPLPKKREEMSKCEVRCRSCHSALHIQMRFPLQEPKSEEEIAQQTLEYMGIDIPFDTMEEFHAIMEEWERIQRELRAKEWEDILGTKMPSFPGSEQRSLIHAP